MTQSEFLTSFGFYSNRFQWTMNDGRLIGLVKNGKNKGLKVNPITAVALARSSGKQLYNCNAQGTLSAAKSLGLTSELTKALMSQATNGHAQVVRGSLVKLLTANNFFAKPS